MPLVQPMADDHLNIRNNGNENSGSHMFGVKFHSLSLYTTPLQLSNDNIIEIQYWEKTSVYNHPDSGSRRKDLQ